jgi:hypothetical protein
MIKATTINRDIEFAITKVRLKGHSIKPPNKPDSTGIFCE